MLRRLLVAGLLLLSPPALAQGACPLTYAAFEFAVPHLDLANCPRDLAKEGVFCRASAGNDAVHVFVFSRTGDQCILATKSYKDGEFDLTVK
jgi:hypothetical protein